MKFFFFLFLHFNPLCLQMHAQVKLFTQQFNHSWQKIKRNFLLCVYDVRVCVISPLNSYAIYNYIILTNNWVDHKRNLSFKMVHLPIGHPLSAFVHPCVHFWRKLSQMTLTTITINWIMRITAIRNNTKLTWIYWQKFIAQTYKLEPLEMHTKIPSVKS